jgi:hypothetical protein
MTKTMDDFLWQRPPRNGIHRMARFGLNERDMVTLNRAVDDGRQRSVSGLMVVPYDIPESNVGGYYPECNPLIPLWHHAEGSHTPAAKSIPVRVTGARPDKETMR